MNRTSLHDMRRSDKTKRETLLETELPTKEPVALFEKWLAEAEDSGTIFNPKAVTVASATKEGKPSARVVLLKKFDHRGFEFATNYDSRKGRELRGNPQAAMLFHWDQQHRQVRIEGRIEKTSPEESDFYFYSRPRDSQLSASLDKQSSVVESKKALDEKYAALGEKYANESQKIPRPENWGGLILIPERFEFWQGQSNRLHDRLVFRRPASAAEERSAVHGWYLERLSP